MTEIDFNNNISSQCPKFIIAPAQKLSQNRSVIYLQSASTSSGWARKKISSHYKTELLCLNSVEITNCNKYTLFSFKRNNMQKLSANLTLSCSGRVMFYQFLRDFAQIKVLNVKIGDIRAWHKIEYISKALKYLQNINHLTCDLVLSYTSVNKVKKIIYPSFFHSLKQLPKLKSLNMVEALAADILTKWEPIIGKYKSLRSLTFWPTVQNDDEYFSILKFLQSSTQIRNLDIRVGLANRLVSQHYLFDHLLATSNLETLTIKISTNTNCQYFQPELRKKPDEIPISNLRLIKFTNEFCLNISDEVTESIALYFSKMEKLEHLEFTMSSMMNATEKTVSSFSQAIRNITLLKTFMFNISYSHLVGPEGFNSFAEALAAKTHLSSMTLDFSRCVLMNTVALENISFGISALTTLEKLSLNFSQISKIEPKGYVSLSQALQKLDKLINLDLNLAKTQVDENSFSVLTEGLKKNKMLEILNLNFSWTKGIKDEGILNLCESLEEMKVVTSLKLNFSASMGMTENGAKALIHTFDSMKQLKSLWLEFYGGTTMDSEMKTKLSRYIMDFKKVRK